MTTNEWITDRLPTEDDTDLFGEVEQKVVHPENRRSYYVADGVECFVVNYSEVVPGMPWRQTPNKEPDRIASLPERIAALERRKKVLELAVQSKNEDSAADCTSDEIRQLSNQILELRVAALESPKDVDRSKSFTQSAPAEPNRAAIRRVVQIINNDSRLIALCNDGSIFQLALEGKTDYGSFWLKLPAIPQL